jgi:hypothetical protein
VSTQIKNERMLPPALLEPSGRSAERSSVMTGGSLLCGAAPCVERIAHEAIKGNKRLMAIGNFLLPCSGSFTEKLWKKATCLPACLFEGRCRKTKQTKRRAYLLYFILL